VKDPFDVEQFRWRGVKPESEPGTAPKKKDSKAAAKRHQTDFYKVPMSWHNALESANASGKTWAIAGRILHADFKAYGEWFKFANGKLEDRISHDTKTRAIELVERLGLIEVKRKGSGRSPMIRILLRH
jgi:hypothetical protein